MTNQRQNIPVLQEWDYNVLERYQHLEVTDLLGGGGYGFVVRAEHKPPNGERSTRAVKVMKVGVSLNNLWREAHFCLLAQHFHCVQTFNFFAAHGLFYIIMENCAGGTLAKYLKSYPNTSRVQQFSKEIGSALHYLHHDVHLAHRDVKPENILLDANRRIKLCDFGIAKYNATELRNTNIGTRDYMPPEMAL